MLPVRICAGGVGTTGVPTATGQHRNDEVNGPSRSGERENGKKQKGERAINQTRNCADTRVCLGKQKTEMKRS